MIFTIFKKELKDTLRERRTLIMTLLIPLLIFPIILNIFVGVSDSFSEKQAEKSIAIGFIGTDDNYVKIQLEKLPENMGDKEIIRYKDKSSLLNYFAV